MATELEFRTLMVAVERKLTPDRVDDLMYMYSVEIDSSRKQKVLQELHSKQLLSNTSESVGVLIGRLEALDVNEGVIEKARRYQAALAGRGEQRRERLLPRPESEERTDYESPRVHTLDSRGSTPVDNNTSSAIVAPGIEYPLSPRGGASVHVMDSIIEQNNTEPTAGEHMDVSDAETSDDEQQATEQELEFIRKAYAESENSTDNNTKVGAILEKDGVIIGRGFNFLPSDDLPTAREAAREEDTKYPYVTHAAVNAVMNAYKAGKSPEGATLYTTHYPSCRDAVILNQAGIRKMAYSVKKRDWGKRYVTAATKRLVKNSKRIRYIPQ